MYSRNVYTLLHFRTTPQALCVAVGEYRIRRQSPKLNLGGEIGKHNGLRSRMLWVQVPPGVHCILPGRYD